MVTIERAVRQASRFYIIDNSFLMDLSEMHVNEVHFWALEPLVAIRSPNAAVVIPRSVRREYERLMGNGNSDPNVNHYEDIGRLLGLERITVYKKDLREALSEKLDQEIEYMNHRQKALSWTDKKIVQAVEDYVGDRCPIGVITADGGIRDKVDHLRNETNADIEIYSPWRVPTTSSASEVISSIDLIVSGNVIEMLKGLQPSDCKVPMSLVVAKNVNIGGRILYDVAFDVYLNRSYASSNPHLEGWECVEYIPLFSVPLTRLIPAGESTKSRTILSQEDFLRVLGYERFALYPGGSPLKFTIFRNGRPPLNALQRKNMLARWRNRQLAARDKEIIDSPNFTIMYTARMDDDEMKYNALATLGTINKLRIKLKKQTVH